MITINKDKIANILLIIAIIFAFFMPTSKNGMPINVANTIVFWTIFSIVIILILLINRLCLNHLIVSILILLYLLLATISVLNISGFRFSVARLAPVLCSLAILCSDYNYQFQKTFLIKVFDITVWLIVFINILILVVPSNVKGFLVNNYTQYLDYVTAYAISLGKPIAFYGVGNIASFFYACIFLISQKFHQVSKKKKYITYMLLMALFCLFIRGTTSLGFCLCMLLFYSIENYNKRKLFLIILISLIMIIVFLQSDLFQSFLNTLSQRANGFFPRYIEGFKNLYYNNVQILKLNPLGIGFTISDAVYYADSGYFVLSTMGNFIFPVLFYALLYAWLKINIRSIEYRLFLLILILLMDLGFISFFSIRTISLIMLTTIFLRNIDNLDKNI